MEKAFQRPHYQPLMNRMEEPRRFIQVLAGPRQVGKTTLVGQILANISVKSTFIAADAQQNSDGSWLNQQWETARQNLRISGASELILAIDEVQKIPNWSEIVKLNWDADTRNDVAIKVILLGSSRLLLQQGLTESLAGRFELTYLGHWSLSEMEIAFGFTPQNFVWFGGYPGAAQLVADEPRWKKYVRDTLIEPSISRDILMLTRVDKPALLRRLFEVGCGYSGKILSFNKLLGQLIDSGNTTTLTNYLELLDSAGLLGGLEKYSGDLIRQRSSSPKFQVHNTALMSAQTAENFEEIIKRPEKFGFFVESAVGAHLINHARTGEFTLHYWRDGNDEIDFILEKFGKIVGIEVKSGSGKAANSIGVFQKKYPHAKMILVGSTGIPWDVFLRQNPVDFF
jgi:uncharacterized protein